MWSDRLHLEVFLSEYQVAAAGQNLCPKREPVRAGVVLPGYRYAIDRLQSRCSVDLFILVGVDTTLSGCLELQATWEL